MSSVDESPVIRVIASLLECVADQGDAPGAAPPMSHVYEGVGTTTVPLLQYLRRWVKYTGAGDVELTCAAVLVDRACTRRDAALTRGTVHRLFLGALTLTAKYREDRPFAMSDYARVGGVPLKELSRIERRFLRDVEWEVGVEPELLERYNTMFQAHPEWARAGHPVRGQAVVRG